MRAMISATVLVLASATLTAAGQSLVAILVTVAKQSIRMTQDRIVGCTP